MEQIVIRLNVSQELALREGRSQFGVVEYAPTDEQLVELSVDERLLLAECKYPIPVDSGEIVWPVVKRAVQKTADERAKQREHEARVAAEIAATRAAELEAAVQKALALPLEQVWERWCENYLACGRRVFGFPGDHAMMRDPRIQARLEEAEPIRVRQDAEAKAAVAAAKARLEAEAAAKEAKREADRKELFGWASARSERIRLGLAEEYDMRGAIADEVVAVVKKAFEAAGLTADLVLVEDRPGWSEHGWTRRTSPEMEALTLLQKLRSELKRLAHELPDSLDIDEPFVARVVRTEDGDEDAVLERWTGIVLYVQHPEFKQRVFVARCDSHDKNS